MLDYLIKKTERDYENAKKQEVVSEENQQTKQKMKENLPKFLAFITHILENNFVIEIIVDDDEDAFQIFETLNERGLALSKSNFQFHFPIFVCQLSVNLSNKVIRRSVFRNKKLHFFKWPERK